jgi:hypothetical protein
MIVVYLVEKLSEFVESECPWPRSQERVTGSWREWHTLPSCFLKTSFSYISDLRPVLPCCMFSFRVSNQMYARISSYACCMFSPFLSLFYHPTNIWWRMQVLQQFSSALYHFLSLRSTCPHQHPLLKLSQCERPRFTPIQNSNMIMVFAYFFSIYVFTYQTGGHNILDCMPSSILWN